MKFSKDGEAYIPIPKAWLDTEYEHPFRIFTYACLCKNANYENESYLIINDVIELSGRKDKKAKDEYYMNIQKELLWLRKENYIEIKTKTNIKSGYSRIKMIRINILDKGMIAYSRLYLDDFNKILSFDNKSREQTLLVYLYVNSKYQRVGFKDGINQYAQGCFDTLYTMSSKLQISEYKIRNILELLSQGDSPIFVKRVFKGYKKEGRYITSRYPNVYIRRCDTMEASYQAIKKILLKGGSK